MQLRVSSRFSVLTLSLLCAESEIMELQRRITTLTAALSEKAEENLEVCLLLFFFTFFLFIFL
jgi:hypothetical protein